MSAEYEVSQSFQVKETRERRVNAKTLPKKKEDPNNAETLQKEKEDLILDYTIYYAINGTYPNELTKKKRAVRKRAGTLIVESGEIYLQRKN